MGTQSGTDPRSLTAKISRRVRRCLHPASLATLLLTLAFVAMFAPGWDGRAQTASTPATSVPLILPTGLAYDAQGSLYFAESGRNLIRKVAPDGTLTTVAGTGVQGFSGDAGPALAADLDSPEAVAFDRAGNLLIADTHNHRIRRVDILSGVITTVAGGNRNQPSAQSIDLPSALASDSAGNLFIADAGLHRLLRVDAGSGAIASVAGNGTQGYSGDGGPATSASLDSPYGVALDPQGNLFLADTHNHRIRRIDRLTGVITSVAGTGQPGFAGDSGAASSAALRLPRGLAIDPAGNLFLIDSANHRLRRIDAATGQIRTVAGDGTQAYAGDNGPAPAASLDRPGAVAVSPAGLATLSDAGNQRVRQVDSAQAIHTIAGLGVSGPAVLDLAVPAATTYGSGQASATLIATPASGSVTFLDLAPGAGTPQPLASAPLVGNAATLSLGTLAVGAHRISASYGGDAAHPPAQSDSVATSIAPAPAMATLDAAAMVFGTPVPPLTGTPAGVLPQDAQAVSLVLSSTASPTAAAGSYPIQSALSGPAAGDYSLVTVPAAVSVTRAAVLTTLSQALAVHVASSTSGVPSGQVALVDGATVTQSATLDPLGNAAFSTANLTPGSHTLTASYGGNRDFLSSVSAPLLLSAGAGTGPDFTLASSGQTAATVPAGSAATFSFAASPVNGALNSPIQLTASGLPPGASASFSPTYLPPSVNPSAFILTVQTLHAANVAGASQAAAPGARSAPAATPFLLALGLPLLLMGRGRRKGLLKLIAFVLAFTTGTLLLNGCASRTNSAAASGSIQVYTVTVIATATAGSGATLQHTAAVTLSVQ